MRGPTIVLVAALAAAVPTAASAQVDLRNDGFESGASAGFQAGFVDGEIAAVSLTPPAAAQVLKVQLLYGGAASTQTITLRIYDDTGAATAPGAQLFEGDFQLTGSNSALQEIDLSSMNVFVPGRFRVGIEFQHAGLPSVARDDDGTITADRNFIFADLGASSQWFRSQALGVTGDWIIRAQVTGGGTPDAGTTPDAATGPDGGGGGPDGGAGDPDAGTAGECDGNNDCQLGEYCDTAVGACTFDCRTDDDCGGDTCNSLGQCLAATGDEGGGCCSTGGGAAGAPWAAGGLAAMVGLGLSLRRRRRS